jgi:hypothetical protein
VRFKMCIAVATLGVLLSGCASVCNRDEKVSEVVSRQSKILQEIIDLRSTADFRAHVEADPVLAAQESTLMAGLSGLVKSADTVSRLECKGQTCGGMNARQ